MYLLRSPEGSPRSIKPTRPGLRPTRTIPGPTTHRRQHLHIIQLLAFLQIDIPRQSKQEEPQLLLNLCKDPLAGFKKTEVTACIYPLISPISHNEGEGDLQA
jgi:hypothetical protein